jgi:hypothetical protein
MIGAANAHPQYSQKRPCSNAAGCVDGNGGETLAPSSRPSARRNEIRGQAPIGPYYADFVCRACKLVVELDGSQHADSAYDDKRDAILVALGYRVLRFWNAEMLGSIDDVCETIVAAVEDRVEPFERFKRLTAEGSVAPHPAGLCPATFSPQAGRRDDLS